MEYTYSLADFDTPLPYERLEQIENPFEKQCEEGRLAEYAKKIKYPQFKKMLVSYRESLNQLSSIPMSTNVTDFQGQKQELRLRTWNADESGIWRIGRENRRDYACSHPIYPYQLLKNIDTGELKVKLAYRRGNDRSWSIQTVDFDTISNARNIVTLSKIGISVVSGQKAQNLVDYINEAIDENYDVLEKTNCVSHLGWNREGFAPYIDEVEFDGNPNFEKVFRAVSSNGSLAAWIDAIVKVRAYSIAAKIVVAASFASCLIEPLGLLPFFVHLWGMDSGTGKSVAQMAGASVWGNPKIGDPFFPTFKGTSTGFELRAGFLRSLPFFMDDLQLDKDKRGGTPFNVYELASGSGKIRGTKTLGLANVPTWGNCFITSGETPIVGEQDGAGAVNRVIEVECTSDRKCIENGYETANLLRENYGFGGRIFIRRLTADGNMELAKKIYELRYSECMENQTTEKQAMAAAVILTADALASEWIFGDQPITVAEMSEFLKRTEEVSASERGYRYMCDWVAMNYNHFGDSENAEIYGLLDPTAGYAYIIRAVFDRACAEKGINAKALLSHLKTKNKIILRRDKRGFTIMKRIRSEMPPVDCVAMKICEEN